MFSLRAFVYWFCFPLVATVRCGQVNNGRGGEDESSSLPLLRGAMGARLSRETGCGGLVAIVLKHDSAFNSYCSRSSHLALVGERSAWGGGGVEGKWILLSPVHQFSGIYMPPARPETNIRASSLHLACHFL